jgi:fibro-slime domain-containing protein
MKGMFSAVVSLRAGRLVLGLACAAGASSLASLAHATPITMNVNYFTLAKGDPDTEQNINGVITNEVRPTLGINGLPVLNIAAYGCISNCYGSQTIHDINPVTGELTYWSPSLNLNVTSSGTGTVTLPYNGDNLFPPDGNGPNDANGYLTALLTTTINVPTTESLQFTLGADDDAFVYLNNMLVCQLGGIHTDVPGPCTTATEAAGNYSLSIFYADVHTTQAALSFSIDTANVTGVTPEPPSILLFASALLALGAAGLRSRRASSAMM